MGGLVGWVVDRLDCLHGWGWLAGGKKADWVGGSFLCVSLNWTIDPPVVRLVPLAVGLRQRNEIELIANAQGMSLMEIESETKLKEMSDQVLEAVFDSESQPRAQCTVMLPAFLFFYVVGGFVLFGGGAWWKGVGGI